MGIQISLPMMAFLVFMTGFAGFVDSAAGGGGLISLPAYLFAGLPPHYTYATNKFSAACGTTFATASFFKNGAMNLKVGILAAIGSFAGSALGAHIVLMLSDEVLQMMMFIILPIAAVVILWRRNLPDENRDDGTLNLKKALLALGIGLGIGLYDGMVGPGTGTFAIIAFTSLMGFDLRTANGNGKVLNLASNYASLFTYLMNGLVVFHIGIPCAISNILGNLLGSHFALKKGARFIRPMMLVVLVLLLALCLRTLQTGLRCPDALGCNICVGIFAALFLQCVINLGMNLQVLPVIGVTLPFFSAGGSSVVMMYLCVGIVLSVGMNTRRSKLDMQRII